MRKTSILALGAVLLGTALAGGSTPASSAVTVRVGIPAAPATECVMWRKNRHRHVKFAYCAEPMYSGEPLIIEGVTYRENLHFRHRNGHREFWVKGRWVVHD